MGVKLKDIIKTAKIGTEVGKLFVPGAAGKVLDIVSKGLDASDDSESMESALKALAGRVDELTANVEELGQALIAVHKRVEKLEGKK